MILKKQPIRVSLSTQAYFKQARQEWNAIRHFITSANDDIFWLPVKLDRME